MAQGLMGAYGPFYGGLLDQGQRNQQRAVVENQGLQGLVGLLSNMQRQQEQSKLLEQQVNIAKLKVQREMAAQQRQDEIMKIIQARMTGQGGSAPTAPLGALPGVNPGTAGVDEMIGAASAPGVSTAPVAAPQRGGSMFSPDELALFSMAQLPGASGMIQAGKLGQSQYEHANMSAAQLAENEDRQRRFELEKRKFGELSASERAADEARRRELQMKEADAADRGLPVPAPAAAPAGAMQVPPEVQAQRDDLRTKILQDERASAMQSGDINAVREIDREIARVGGRPGPNPARVNDSSLRAPTKSLMSPRQEREIAAKREEERPQAVLSLRDTTKNLAELEKAASKLASHPGLSRITGPMDYFPNFRGSDASDAQALLDTLKTKTFITTLQALRAASKTGGAVGNVSDREGARMEIAIASLANSQSEEQMKQSLSDIARFAQEGRKNIEEAFALAYPTHREKILPPQGSSARGQGGSQDRVLRYQSDGSGAGRIIEFDSSGRRR